MLAMNCNHMRKIQIIKNGSLMVQTGTESLVVIMSESNNEAFRLILLQEG